MAMIHTAVGPSVAAVCTTYPFVLLAVALRQALGQMRCPTVGPAPPQQARAAIQEAGAPTIWHSRGQWAARLLGLGSGNQ